MGNLTFSSDGVQTLEQPKMKGLNMLYFFLVVVVAVNYANAETCTDACDSIYNACKSVPGADDSVCQTAKNTCYAACGNSGSRIKLSSTCGVLMVGLSALLAYIGK